MNTPIVAFKGDHGDIGLEHGRKLKERVKRNVSIYMDAFQEVTSLDRDEVFARAEKVMAACESYSPELVEELQGIARGAGCHVFEILAINARLEIIYSGDVISSSDAMAHAAEGCTSAVALPEITTGGRTLIGQNWDWLPAMRDGLVIQKIDLNGAPRLVTMCEAGIIGKVGLNQAGIGLCANALTADQNALEGVPFHFMFRKALQADTLAEAIGAIGTAPRAGGINALLARDGEALNLETSPVDIQIVYPDRGIIAHSNNFQSLNPRFRDAQFFLSPFPSTFMRWRRVDKIMREKSGDINERTFMTAFADHFDYPLSVCWHPNPKLSGARQRITAASLIMDLNARAMWFTDDYPCQGKYERLDFSDFLR
ncbi:MAG: hypothetical protein JRG73_00620 [Deltaproteobacteria bacterium]|nr:hypothetical protein [Deltaproteobacteria bacterium]